MPGDLAALKAAAGGKFEQVAAAISSPELDTATGPGPLRRVSAMNAILAALEAPLLPLEPCCGSVPAQPALATVTPLALTAGAGLEPFAEFCFGCHRGNPSAHLDFMNGADETAVWQRMAATREAIDETLDWQRSELPMPPPGSRQWRHLKREQEHGRQPLVELRSALAGGTVVGTGSMSWPLILAGGALLAGVGTWLLIALAGLFGRLRWQRESMRLNRDYLQRREQLAAVQLQNAQVERPAWDGYHKFEVRSRHDEVPGVVSLELEPHDQQPLPTFKAGQYLTVQLPGSARPMVRCYSLSARPHSDHYRITVKREPAPDGATGVPPGLASNWLYEHAVVGTIIDVRAPAGHFCVAPGSAAPLVFVAGGIGITPLLGILDTLAAEDSQRRISLLYGVRDGSRHIFSKRLQELAGELPGLRVQVSYSRPREEDQQGPDYDYSGRITIDRLRQWVGERDSRFYLCGPATMTAAMATGLAQWGVAREHVMYEAFHSMDLDLSAADRGQVAATVAQVRFARSGKTVSWEPGVENLLSLAERHGISIDRGCRAGNCGSCVVAIKSGKVRYVGHHDVKPERGTCLACVAAPCSDLVLDA